MAQYDDEQTDNIALQNLLAKPNAIQAPVDPKAPFENRGAAISGAIPPPSAMDVYNKRLAAGDVSPDPTQRARELQDAQNATATAPVAPDSSKWDTDGYAKPGYTAQKTGRVLLDETKWNDPNHQTPKYVVQRIMSEAMGEDANLANPEKRQAAIANILKAYPGSTYNGKDKITFPDGGTVDVFGKSGAGLYEPAWMPETGPGGAPLPGGGAGVPDSMDLGPSSTERIQSLVPTDVSTYQTLLKKLQGIVGPESTDRQALMALMTRNVG